MEQKFSAAATEPAFTAIDRLATRDARALAREFLDISPAQFAAELKRTPLSRAGLTGLKRNARTVLGDSV